MFYNTDYGSYENAAPLQDGLAAISVLLKVGISPLHFLPIFILQNAWPARNRLLFPPKGNTRHLRAGYKVLKPYADFFFFLLQIGESKNEALDSIVDQVDDVAVEGLFH